MKMRFDALPSCFAVHRPEPPNNCETCEFRPLCFRVVLVEDLKPIIAKLEKALQEARA